MFCVYLWGEFDGRNNVSEKFKAHINSSVLDLPDCSMKIY